MAPVPPAAPMLLCHFSRSSLCFSAMSQPTRGQSPATPTTTDRAALFQQVQSVFQDLYEVRRLVAVSPERALFVVRDSVLKREVALRVHLQPENMKSRRWFERETELLACLDHSSLRAVYAAGYRDEWAYRVVKWIDGESLEAAATRAPRSFPRVLHIARSLTSLLEFVHSSQIAVRRIVPSTVMLENTGRVIVIDLRYANVCIDVADTWHESSTPFVAPEIRAGGGGDPESDIYTAGALLFFALTGYPPAEDPTGIVRPSEIRTTTPAAIDRMVMRALKQDPAERFHSATEMSDALTSDTGDIRDLIPVIPTGGTVYEDTRAWEKHLRRALGDEYELLRELGSGGFGRVYLVRDLELEREAALKILHPFLTSDPAVVERFRREAQIAARLVHEHIANTYEIGGRSGLLWYTMEFVPGGSLAQAVELEGPLEVARVLQLLYESLDALQHAHRHGLVHRDLKPENILFAGPEGSVRIADFGLAFAHEHHSRFGGASTSHSGTPEFAAPEQLLGEKVDHRTDLYSLSLCAYFALTGSLPFGTGTPLSLIASHATGTLPNVTAMRQDVNAGFLRVLATAAAREPANRFDSAEEFAAALRRHAGSGKSTLLKRLWRAVGR